MKELLVGATLAMLAGSAIGADPAVVERYQKSCSICHDAGVSGAPKSHVAEAWKPHLAKGADVLLNSVRNGLNAMPPRGMCFDCSDADFKALIDYMAAPL
jgi:cytochrome c5